MKKLTMVVFAGFMAAAVAGAYAADDAMKKDKSGSSSMSKGGSASSTSSAPGAASTTTTTTTTTTDTPKGTGKRSRPARADTKGLSFLGQNDDRGRLGLDSEGRLRAPFMVPLFLKSFAPAAEATPATSKPRGQSSTRCRRYPGQSESGGFVQRLAEPA